MCIRDRTGSKVVRNNGTDDVLGRRITANSVIKFPALLKNIEFDIANPSIATGVVFDGVDASFGSQIDATDPTNVNLSGDTDPATGLSAANPNVLFPSASSAGKFPPHFRA